MIKKEKGRLLLHWRWRWELRLQRRRTQVCLSLYSTFPNPQILWLLQVQRRHRLGFKNCSHSQRKRMQTGLRCCR